MRYCIVGAGFSGAVIGRALAEAGHRVLVIDDNLMNTQLLVRLFSELPQIEVITALCEGVRSPADACSRSRRLSLPLSALSSAASAEASTASCGGFRWRMCPGRADTKVNYKGRLRIAKP